jgi:hypothetical protein
VNHIGLGIAGNVDHVVITMLLSKKYLCVTKICESKEGGFEIRGKMIEPHSERYGIYAARIADVDKIDNPKESGVIFGPEKIDYDRSTKEFKVYVNDMDEGN